MKVEYFYAEGCNRCADSRKNLQAAVLAADPGAVWREVNALKEIDYAVELGVATLPAVAIDGKLEFYSAPTTEQLTKAVTSRLAAAHLGR